MAEMLAHPDWFMSHALQSIAFAAMTMGLWLFGRSRELHPSVRAWLGLAIAGTLLQTVEMIVHTAAMVDHMNLVDGASTPVLTTHLWMTMALYPVFAITVSGFIITAASTRALGRLWLAPIGVVGLLAHAAAAVLVVGMEIEEARVLFPGIVLLAVWLLGAVVVRPRVPVRAA
jgi:hypothetical protein